MKEQYLPAFYRERYPTWSEERIQEKISQFSPEEEQRKSNEKDGIIAKPFEEVLPASEKQKDHMLDLLREYNRGMAKLKQFDSNEVHGKKYNLYFCGNGKCLRVPCNRVS